MTQLKKCTHFVFQKSNFVAFFVIGGSIHIGQEIQCLPLWDFFFKFSYYIQIMKTNCRALSYLSFIIPKPILLYLIDSTLCSKQSFWFFNGLKS